MKMKPTNAMLLLLVWGTATCAMELTQDDLQRRLLAAVQRNKVKKAAFYLSCGADPQTPCGQKGWTTLTYLRAITDFFSKRVNNYQAMLTQAREEGYDPEPYEQDSGAEMLELLRQRHPILEIPQTNLYYFSYRDATAPMMSLASYRRAASLIGSFITAPIRGGVRSFIASQIEGSRALLAFGRSAGEALLTQATKTYDSPADEASSALDTIPADDLIAKLVQLFLNNPEEYKKSVAIFPLDLRNLLARALLSGHSIKNFLKEQLELRSCIDTLKTDRRVDNVEYKRLKITKGRVGLGDGHNTNELEIPLAISDAETGSLICTLRPNPQEDNQTDLLKWVDAEEVTFNHDRSKVVTIPVVKDFQNQHAVLWDTHSGSCLNILQGQTIHGHSGAARASEFSPDGMSLLNTSYYGVVNVWSVKSGEHLRTLTNEYTSSAHFHPFDSTRIVTAREMVGNVWDAESGLCILTLEGHSGYVCYARYNKTGDKIVTASHDMTIKIWDANTGECLHTLRGHARSVSRGQFNPAGNKIISVDAYNEAKVWNVGRLFALKKWLETTCSLEEALLLHCISVTHRFHKILSKRPAWAHLLQSAPQFDFNRCPHLQEIFDSFPAEFQIQDILAPSVVRCLTEESDSEIEDDLCS